MFKEGEEIYYDPMFDDPGCQDKFKARVLKVNGNDSYDLMLLEGPMKGEVEKFASAERITRTKITKNTTIKMKEVRE